MAGPGTKTLHDPDRDEPDDFAPGSPRQAARTEPESTSPGVRWQSSRRLAMGTGSIIPGTPYKLVRWLGDGGMGAVFEAEHVDIERRVAVKIMHAQRQRLQWVVKGFRNEARASARIGAPNIVEIYDFKELDDGRLLIAMEFLDGPTLREELERAPPSWPRLMAIGRQICKGLAAAHGAGIIHRDIKPENIILVERDGRPDFVKLLDFGVAYFMKEEVSARVGGTAHYMAPESTRGATDTRADIYAVGCLLHELAIGHPPFDGDTTSGIMLKQREQEPTAPSAAAPERGIPASFDRLVLRCLAKEPDERFETMDALEAALCELQLERGWVTAWDDLPPPAIEQDRRARLEAGLRALNDRSRRPRWPRLLLAGLAGAAVVTGVLLAWPKPPDPAVQDAALERHTRAARRAAGQFYFVYPPRDAPEGSTAYREVLALEALGETPAAARAAELRQEFADTLARLGDRYWDFPGARPFAYEYYAASLVFAPNERVSNRAGLTPIALERLRAKAARGQFSDHELLATAPLVALAEAEPRDRVAGLEALRSDEAIPATVAASIDRVLDHDDLAPLRLARGRRGERGRARARSSASPAAAATTGDPLPVGTTTATGGIGEPREDGRTEAPDHGEGDLPVLPRSRREPAVARDLVQQAEAALTRGDRSGAEVLFNRALAADRRNLDALDGLANIAFQGSRYAQSVRLLERAIKLGSRSSRRWISLGDAYFKTLRYPDARKAYARAQALGNREAAGRLAKVDKKLGG